MPFHAYTRRMSILAYALKTIRLFEAHSSHLAFVLRICTSLLLQSPWLLTMKRLQTTLANAQNLDQHKTNEGERQV
jgi:hypothetical protein